VSGPEQQRSSVTQFPLVEPGAPETLALIAIVRRLSIARSIGEVIEIVTHAARTLLGADGITFVLREGATFAIMRRRMRSLRFGRAAAFR
jgi:hypothetical protein